MNRYEKTLKRINEELEQKNNEWEVVYNRFLEMTDQERKEVLPLITSLMNTLNNLDKARINLDKKKSILKG